jgi:ligand-binding sensor domain-containing protein/signal transduction histidine kinase
MMSVLRLGGNVLLGCLILLYLPEVLCRAVGQPMERVSLASGVEALSNRFRPPVNPRHNVDDFPAVAARFVRFKVLKTNLGEPCLDELEVYPEGQPIRNVALASAGAKATASGSLPGYQIHQVAGVNDGQYGNGHSWVADKVSGAWIQIELPRTMRINRVVWSRDREGFFVDRLATDYRIEVSQDGIEWQTVASSADRVAPMTGDVAVRWSPMMNPVNRLGPVGVAAGPENAPSSCDYSIDRWQTEDGLSDNTVTAILQTRDGYVWVGTLEGLVRFDGVKFERYGAAEGLFNERVLCLYQDEEGRLWVGTDGGGLFYLNDEQFRAVTTRDGLSSDVVLDVSEDASHQIWIGTYAGLDCWKGGRFLKENSLPARPQANVMTSPVLAATASVSEPWRQPPTHPAPVSRIAFDLKGRLWSVVGNRLFQVGLGSYVMPRLEGEPSGQNAIAALRLGPSGRLWFGGISGYVAALSNGLVRVLSQPGNLSPDMILDICETRNGDVWMGTASSGLRGWRDKKVLSLTTEEGLADNSVRCVFEDREENLWIGTSYGGLNRLTPKKLRLITARDGLSHNVVTSMAEGPDGEIWIGSNGGGLSKQRDGAFTPAELSYLLDNESISSLLVAHNGDLWIGTWSSGLIRKVGEHIKQISIARQWGDEPVLALCEDRAGRLWVGTYQDGLKCFQDGKFTSYRTTNGLSANYITTLAQDEKWGLWIGTGGYGLNRYANGVFQVLTRRDGLASDFVRTLYVDGEGVLWIGTSGGLSRLKDGHLTTFTKQQGLWDDVISQILEDDSGHLWFGSNRGIFRVRKEALNAVAERRFSAVNCLVFGKEEGMQNLECTGGFCPAGLRTRDGRLWFSTVNGLAIIDPKNTPVNSAAPPVVLESVRVDGKKVGGGHWATDDRHPSIALRIPPGARRVEFQYTALSFTAPDRVRFRYRLDGLDADWVEAGDRRVAEYPYLPPGQYRFRVAACHQDSAWSDGEAGLALICLPAFWQTEWFRLLMAILGLSGAGWTVKYLVTQQLRQRLAVLQQQNALERERTRIARDIHDELGTLLTEISLLSDHGQKHRDQPADVEGDLRRISNTAREAVQTAEGIVWAVNSSNDSLGHLANYFVHFAEDFFRLTPIRCRLDVPVNLPRIPLSTQHRHHLLLAVKETCNNIVRHSGATEVWLRIVIADLEFSITIEDNGKGFCPDTLPEGSHGLLNLRQRMMDIGGCFQLSSEPGRGTRVKLEVPLL